MGPITLIDPPHHCTLGSMKEIIINVAAIKLDTKYETKSWTRRNGAESKLKPSCF